MVYAIQNSDRRMRPVSQDNSSYKMRDNTVLKENNFPATNNNNDRQSESLPRVPGWALEHSRRTGLGWQPQREHAKHFFHPRPFFLFHGVLSALLPSPSTTVFMQKNKSYDAQI